MYLDSEKTMDLLPRYLLNKQMISKVDNTWSSLTNKGLKK